MKDDCSLMDYRQACNLINFKFAANEHRVLIFFIVVAWITDRDAI